MTIRYSDSLPALQIANVVNQQLAENSCLVITAPPGAGKSTLLPLTMLQGLGSSGKILVLEPRRIAARQIAERMAHMLGEQVGETVGYRVRFENKVGKSTRIEVLTEGILTKMLVADPTLEGVSIVVFDEYHERSLHSDVAMALTREAQQIVRSDLKIVVMSATIDAESICNNLHAPLVESEGRLHPVEIHYVDSEVVPMIREAHERHQGDILVFLPGEFEIRNVQQQLANSLGHTHICPLYGLLPFNEQQSAIAQSLPGERKVVLATSIAETSITIEGVHVVIDSGLCRKMIYDAQRGLSRLDTVQISQDMADQRAGRAGRLSAGVCYRLWNKAVMHRMNPCRVPEIMEADLSSMLLDIAAWGEKHPERLPWMTPPPISHIAQGKNVLQLLDAIDEEGSLTAHGKEMAEFPSHPRISNMILRAHTPALKLLACDIAALLEVKDPLLSISEKDADINTRIEELRQHSSSVRWNKISRISEQYRRMCKLGSNQKYSFNSFDAGALLACCFPERIAKSIEGSSIGRFRLASGDNAYVDTEDALSSYEWLSVAQVNAQGGGRIFLAAPVDEDYLLSLSKVKDLVRWDSKQGIVVACKEWRIGQLLLKSQPLQTCSRERLVEVICEAVSKEGTSMLNFNEDVTNLQQRVALVSIWHPELELPDLSTETVLQRASEWLPMYLEKAATVAEMKKIDLVKALWGLLDYEQQLLVDRLAPTRIEVPSGSKIKVEYRHGAELPILRVRLQECFGMAETPKVDDGQKPLLMELLSPGFKPVQLTQDLHSFWEETYFEVRKELRRRYPKHAWPDNPMESQAVRGVVKKC